MALNQPFTTVPTSTTNVDFKDLLAKTGYITYYLANGGSSPDYIWTTNTSVYSQFRKTYSNNDTVSITYVDTIALTADLEFLVPQNLKGDLFINVPCVSRPDASGHVPFRRITVGIYHYDGSTETQIGSDINSGDLTGVEDGAFTAEDIAYLLLPIASATHFSKGEFLRVKITLACKNTSSRSTDSGIGHDPQNRDDINEHPTAGTRDKIFNDGFPTQLKMEVPFEVE